MLKSSIVCPNYHLYCHNFDWQDRCRPLSPTGLTSVLLDTDHWLFIAHTQREF